MERSLAEALPRVEEHLAERLLCSCSATLEGVREVHADQIAPPARGAARGGAASSPAVSPAGWSGRTRSRWPRSSPCSAAPARWESPRAFTRIEQQVLGGALAGIAEIVLRAVGRELDDAVVVDSLRAFGSWRDGGDAADAHRLAVDLSIGGIGEEPSELQVYLPGIAAGAEDDESAPAELPHHLDHVAVDLVVTLGETEIPLAQLLELEEGDVIPLGTPSDGLLSLSVDGWELGKARLGHRDGHVAVAFIEPVDPRPANDPTQEPS